MAPDAQRQTRYLVNAIRQDVPTPDGWRRMIGRQVKAYGYSHLLIDTTSPNFQDIRNAPGEWGMARVADVKNYSLYKLL